jgi:hypothetical protein
MMHHRIESLFNPPIASESVEETPPPEWVDHLVTFMSDPEINQQLIESQLSVWIGRMEGVNGAVLPGVVVGTHRDPTRGLFGVVVTPSEKGQQTQIVLLTPDECFPCLVSDATGRYQLNPQLDLEGLERVDFDAFWQKMMDPEYVSSTTMPVLFKH